VRGYGRGYYGNDQIATAIAPRRRSGGGGRGWLTATIVVGLGAAIWFLWPRRDDLPPKLESAMTPTPPPSPPSPERSDLPPSTYAEEIDRLARARGFSSTQMFEDSVIATARELQASGAKIDLGPHLAHLASRLEHVD